MSVLSSFIRPFHPFRKLTGRALISIDQSQIEFIRLSTPGLTNRISRIIIDQMCEISVELMDINVTRFSNISSK